jgi:hypothetical protein
MIAVAIAAIALAAGAVATVAWVVHQLLGAKAGERVALDIAHAAERALVDCQEQWRLAKVEAEQQHRRADSQERRARRAEEALNAHVRSTTLNGSDDDVAALVSGMLRTRFPDATDYRDDHAADRGNAAVQPAAAAGAAGGRVDPGAGGGR